MAEEACTAQVVVASQSHSEGEGAEDDVIHLDPADSFSVPEQAVTTPSTLDRGRREETTGPPISEAMSAMVSHLMQTPLLPEKLKLCMDRDLNPRNAPYVSAKKVNPTIFNKGGGPMAIIRGHDLQLQSIW